VTGRHDVAAPSRGVLANLRVVWHLVGPDRRGLAVGVVATVLLALLLLVPPLLTKILIDDGITTGDTDVVAGVALASLGLVVVSLGLQVAASYFTYAPSATMVVVLQRQMFRRLVGLPSGYRTTLPVGITLSRLTNDAAESRSLITAGLPVVVTNVVSIVGSVVLMFVIDRRLAMATIAFVLPVLWLITRMYRRVVVPVYHRLRDTIGEVTRSAGESLAVVPLIQSYNQEERHRDGFLDASRRSADTEMRSVRLNAVYIPATSLVSTVAMAVLVMLGGVQVVRGRVEVGTVVAFFGYLQAFLGPLVQLSSMLRNYEASSAALDKCIDVLDEPAPDAAGGIDLPRPPGALRFDDVGLSIDGRAVLEDLSLTVGPGSIVAVVGDASSGRAEVGRLAAGLAAPTSGSVTLGGVELVSATRASRVATVGYVSAVTVLFEGSVGDNLRLAEPRATDDELRAHLSAVFGEQLVDVLAAGLETPVGRGGLALPAGTRQAVLIARALAAHPDILVLDGATDYLDPTALRRMVERRRSASSRVTILATTGQPLIADHADLVVVLRDGRVVERGTPAEMLAAGGAYAHARRDWQGGLDPEEGPTPPLERG
jgi:ATP-binding cassette subfamily B protein